MRSAYVTDSLGQRDRFQFQIYIGILTYQTQWRVREMLHAPR